MAYAKCPKCGEMAYNLVILSADKWHKFTCKCGHKFRTLNDKAQKAKVLTKAINEEFAQ